MLLHIFVVVIVVALTLDSVIGQLYLYRLHMFTLNGLFITVITGRSINVICP